MSDKKYYWLKLKKDFFKRHDIQIIENMPNGKDYVLFYLKLLVESVDHEGGLRFNETIPYNEQMLATITNTNIDTVSNAMKLFRELGMVEILDDKTIYMNEVSKMLGTETYWAQKKREEREKKKLPKPATPQIGQCPIDVQGKSNVSKQEIEIEIEKESFSFTGGEAPIQGEDRRLRLPTKENEFFVIYPASVVQWEKQYPSVDVVRELGQMADWCRKNPGKRKSKSEMLPFVARWLRRAQEKGEEDRGADEPIAPGDDGEQIAILRRLADRARRKEEERC